MVKLIVENGGKVNLPAPFNFTPLSLAVLRGNCHWKFRKLQKNPWNSTKKKCEKITILFFLPGARENVEILLENGADLNYQSINNDTIVHEMVLHSTSSPICIDKVYESLFCDRAREDILQILIKHGIEIDAKNIKMNTALFYAAKFGIPNWL